MRHICTSIVATLVLAGTSFAATINVPGDYATIQDAVNAVQDGDTIRISSGTYYEHILLNSDDIHDGYLITIEGDPDGPRPVIDGQYANQCLLRAEGMGSQASVRISNLIFTRGFSGDQYNTCAAINVFGIGEFELDGCAVTKCNVTYTGGNLINLESDVCRVENCEIIANTSKRPLKISYSNNLVIEDVEIRNNADLADGGHTMGIHLYYCPGAVVRDCVVTGNMTFGNPLGLGIWAHMPFYMYNTMVCGNAGSSGGTQVFGAWEGSGNVISEHCGDGSAPLGACCLETECVEADPYECGLAGGNFIGPLTSCDQVDCSNEGNLGACCIGGMCSESNEYTCISLGGEWAGDYTNCSDVACTPPPAIAACCVSDNCLTTLESVCDLLGGTWQGDTSDCKSAACDPWVGACCVAGACTQISLDDCANLGGTYFGDLTTCEDTECPGTCLGDLNGDGDVSVDDILILISGYGPCP